MAFQLRPIHFSSGSRQGLLNGPSIAINARKNQVGSHPSDFCPLRCRLGLPIPSKVATCRSVSCLSRASGPLAVLWRVRSIVVNAINLMLTAWSWPHVCDEVRKLAPSLANDNATSAPLGVSVVVWIFASCFHVQPSTILGSKLVKQAMHMALAPGSAVGIDGGSERPFGVPSSTKTLPERDGFHVEMVCPLGKRFGFTTEFDTVAECVHC